MVAAIIIGPNTTAAPQVIETTCYASLFFRSSIAVKPETFQLIVSLFCALPMIFTVLFGLQVYFFLQKESKTSLNLCMSQSIIKFPLLLTLLLDMFLCIQ